jgi:type IV pilus assembly protein PilA
MFCYSCGASLPDNTQFCSNCGRPAQGPTPGASTEPGAANAAAGTQPTPTPASAPAAGSPWLNVPAMTQPQPPMQRPVYAGEAQTDGKATGSLILGILSLLCLSFLAGIPAIILGHMSRKNIRESMGRLKGDGMALAGLIMGYISVAAIPMILIIAAIVIPNVLHAKLSANDSAAASRVRTLNTSEITYTTMFPSKGFARSLEVLGPGSSGQCASGGGTDAAACLIDSELASGTKGGFRYSISAICGTDDVCTDYVIAATPAAQSTGTKSYCSTADAVVRFQPGVASPPATVEECAAWSPL